MPIYNFACVSCKAPVRKILSPENYKLFVIFNEYMDCKKCGGRVERKVNPPSSQTVETLDNGLMPKRVERFADAETLYKERSKKSDENSGR